MHALSLIDKLSFTTVAASTRRLFSKDARAYHFVLVMSVMVFVKKYRKIIWCCRKRGGLLDARKRERERDSLKNSTRSRERTPIYRTISFLFCYSLSGNISVYLLSLPMLWDDSYFNMCIQSLMSIFFVAAYTVQLLHVKTSSLALHAWCMYAPHWPFKTRRLYMYTVIANSDCLRSKPS